jgi:hypothetical protein
MTSSFVKKQAGFVKERRRAIPWYVRLQPMQFRRALERRTKSQKSDKRKKRP